MFASSCTAIASGCVGNNKTTATETTESKTGMKTKPTNSPTQTIKAPVEVNVQGDWPTYQNNQSNTGYTPQGLDKPDPIGVGWRISSNNGGIGYETQPAVADGKVILGQNDAIEIRDAERGTQDRLIPLETGGAVVAIPTYSEGTIYASTYSEVYSIDADSGSIRWHRRGEHGGLVAPTVVGDDLVVAEGSVSEDVGSLFVLDRKSGEPRWIVALSDGTKSVPAIADGTVFAASSDGRVCAFDRADGSELWTFEADGAIYSSPSIGDGTVYVADDDGVVYALDANQGTELWRTQQVAPSDGSALAVSERVLYVSGWQWLVALNTSDGSIRWKHSLGDAVATSPSVTDNAVYVGTGEGDVLALDRENGKPLWEFHVRSITHEDTFYWGISEGISVVDGGVFVTTDAGDVYALGPATENE